MNEPMESSSLRRGSRSALKGIVQTEAKEPQNPQEPVSNVEQMFHYEAVEVAANALITALVRTEPEIAADLAHTGAVRTAVQLIYNISVDPSREKNYNELHSLLETLSLYHRI